jgi:hypothetical protein
MSTTSPRRNNVSAQRLRKAASSIQVPDEQLLLPTRMRTNTRKLEAALRRFKSNSPRIRSMLAELSRQDSSQGQHVMGGGFSRLSPFIRVDQISSYMDFLNSLYVPTGSKTPVLPGHYYYLDQAWPSSLGGTAATKVTGGLSNYSLANVSKNNESSYAGVYILVPTDQKNYGKLSTVTFESSGNWSVKLLFNTDWDWARNVAGSIRITARMKLVAYVYNVATNSFDPLLNNSMTSNDILFGSSTGSGYYAPAKSGALDNFSLQFIAEPARQYLLGVVSQVQIVHNLTDDVGKPLRTPPQGAFTCYGIVNTTVDSMYVNHKILVA